MSNTGWHYPHPKGLGSTLCGLVDAGLRGLVAEDEVPRCIGCVYRLLGAYNNAGIIHVKLHEMAERLFKRGSEL